MKSRPHVSSSGFSLAEVVVALLVFQIGLLAIATLTVRAQEAAYRARSTETGVSVVRAIADSLRGVGAVAAGRTESLGLMVEWGPAGTSSRGVTVRVRAGERPVLDAHVVAGGG